MSNNQTVLIDHEMDEAKKYFVVNWNIGSKCNFKCSYCSDVLNDGTFDWLNKEKLLSFADKIIKQCNDSNKIPVFTFSGGEVTLFKDLIYVLKYLKNKNCFLEILSNGSQNLPYWEKIIPLLDHIVLSFHPEQCNKQHFIDVVNYISKTIVVHVNIMMHPKLFDISIETGLEIYKNANNVTLIYQPLLAELSNSASVMDYTEEQKARISQLNKDLKFSKTRFAYRSRMVNFLRDGSSKTISTDEYINTKSNNWKGWLCWAGLEQIVITHDKKVFRAWCMQDFIGDFEEIIKLPEHPVICSLSKCHCNMDMLIRKQIPILL